MNEIQTIPSDIKRFNRNLFAGLRRNFLFRKVNTITKMYKNNAKDEITIELLG